MTSCPVSQAEIDNDKPYRSHNRDAMEEHDRATDNLIIAKREFIESMIKNGCASVKHNRLIGPYYLTDAIEMISDQAFWGTVVTFTWEGETETGPLSDIFCHGESEDFLTEVYLAGLIPQWHAEIHKQVVLLADMALGEV